MSLEETAGACGIAAGGRRPYVEKRGGNSGERSPMQREIRGEESCVEREGDRHAWWRKKRTLVA